MPTNFVRCVDDLIKSGKDKNSAYAICTTQYQKSHKGKNPQDAPTASAEVMGKFYEMVKAAQTRNNMPMSVSEMKKMMIKYLKEKETQRKKVMK